MIKRYKEKIKKFKSAKLILAIIAVGFLQIAFVIYIGNDITADIAANVPGPPEMNANVPNEIADDTNLTLGMPTDLNTGPVETAPSTGSAPSRTRSLRSEVKSLAVKVRKQNITKSDRIANIQIQRSFHADLGQRPERYASRVQLANTARSEFGSRVISYRKYNSSVTTTNVLKAKKRSLVAKAMPMFKKPWDLIKAIGSKLN